jgi:tRNA(Ile)-lysidine synthase
LKNNSIKKNFIVAVSGGPDSLALSFLSKIYSIKKIYRYKSIYSRSEKLRKRFPLEAKFVQKKIKKFFYKIEYLNLEKE